MKSTKAVGLTQVEGSSRIERPFRSELSDPSETVLHMDLLDVLKKRKKFLDLMMKHKSIINKKNGKGTLRVAKRGHRTEYYLHISKDNEQYIKKSNINFAIELAQTGYEQRVLDVAQKELKQVNKLISFLQESSISKLYDNMAAGRKKLVTPLEMSDEEYRTAWEQETWDIMDVNPDQGDFVSDKGVRVRSKVELLIANALERYDIPYRYEYPLVLDGLGRVRPDFVCLNLKKRREIVWEHFGMMDDPDYAIKNVKKIAAYENSGFDNEKMIMTFETSYLPLSTSIIKNKIASMLL